jgi:hypothetical protein
MVIIIYCGWIKVPSVRMTITHKKMKNITDSKNKTMATIIIM